MPFGKTQADQIDLVTEFSPYVDEKFKRESKLELLTNKDFDWTGANTIKVYKVTSSPMNDYDRAGTGAELSRYGKVLGLDATTQEMTITKDRSFTFAIDTLDSDETGGVLESAKALERQQREVIIPEVDTYVYKAMTAKAGTKPTALALTPENIYGEILKANNALDNAEVPEMGRVLVVTPDIYATMKKSKDIIMATDISDDQRKRGVIGMIDGLTVVRVPANRLPNKFGFMVAHPVATVAPVKLAEYKIHKSPPFISGDLVEGRIVYDAFVLENKAKAIYYQAIS